MGLKEYKKKRHFNRTSEPEGKVPKRKKSTLSFVIHKHAARRLHYDLRLELDGVLKSWAVPKGPSLDPADKRLAVQVEDHPLDYGSFEGVIPEGEYGAGEVIVWDNGTWIPVADPHAGLKKGHLHFTLNGKKLKGDFSLIKIQGRPAEPGKTNWLLVKEEDKYAGAADIVSERPKSVKSGKKIEDLGEAKPARRSSSKGGKISTAILSPALQARLKRER